MIYVCPLSQVEKAVAAHAPSHLVTLVGPTLNVETPTAIQPDRHLRLIVNDVRQAVDGQITPEEAHVRTLIEFVGAWDRTAPMLIHCWAGVSRSTAAAFITLCAIDRDTPEQAHADRLRKAAPFANPNTLLVHHADAILGRDGRMSEAVELLDLPEPVDEGELFSLPLSRAASGR